MSTVKIDLQVGGVSDVRSAFKSVETEVQRFQKAAGKAGTEGSRAARQVGDDSKRAWQTAAKEAEKAARDQMKAQERAAKDTKKAAADVTRAFEQEAKKQARAAEQSQKEQTRTAEREERERSRTASRELNARFSEAKRVMQQEERLAASHSRAFKRDALGRVGGTLSGAATMAGRLAVGAMTYNGALNLGDAIRDRQSAQASAIQLSNSAYNPLDKNTKRYDPKALQAQARAVEIATNVKATDVLEGLHSYVALSSDASVLDPKSTMAQRMAMIAKGSGTSFGDVASLMGNVRAENKHMSEADAFSVLTSVIGQGKSGAVELDELARKGGKIASTAGSYAGDQTENQRKLLGLAQVARRVTGTSESATAVTRLAGDVSKHGDEMEKAGAKVFTRDAKGNKLGLADPAEVIGNLMAATHGDAGKLSKMGIGISSMRLFDASRTVYNDAYAGASGSEKDKRLAAVDAVKKDIKSLEGASYSETDAKKDAAAVLAGDAERFDASLTRAKETLADAFEPAMKRIADKLPEWEPRIQQVIEATGQLAGFLMDHPLAGAITALTAAVGKDVAAAGIGQLIRNLVIGGGGGAGGVGGAGGGGLLGGAARIVGAGLGTAAGGAAIVATGAIAGGVGGAIVGSELTDWQENSKARANRLADDVKSGKVSPQDAARMVEEARAGVGGFSGRLSTLPGVDVLKAQLAERTGMSSTPASQTPAGVEQQKKYDALALVDSKAIRDAISAAIREGAQSGAKTDPGAPGRNGPLSSPPRGGAGS